MTPSTKPAPTRTLTRPVARFVFGLFGWRITGALPDIPRYVIIVAPHTSNWDFFVLLGAKFALGVSGGWIGKHTIFRWPVRGLLLWLGGIPVDRTNPAGIVERVVHEFTTRERFVFALAPEGTRRRVTRWRSGYWRIARAANVPIVPVGLDYGARTIVLNAPLTTTESLENDERTLRGYFAHVRARHPKNYIG